MKTLRSFLITAFFAVVILFAFLVRIARSPERAANEGSSASPVAAKPAPQSDQVEASVPKIAATSPEITQEMKDAVRNSLDVSSMTIGTGAVMFKTSYGPCGILYRQSQGFLWHEDPGTDQLYPDMSSAIVAAESQCEAFFLDEKKERDAVRSANASQSPSAVPPK